MGKLLIYLIISLGVNTNQKIYNKLPKGLGEKLIGVWEYQYSSIDNKQVKVKLNSYCPTYKIVFQKNNDETNIELKKLPDFVMKLRRNNSLKNIKCQTFDKKNKLIDSFFPISKQIKDKVRVSNFGNINKFEYYIDYVDCKSLVIFDGLIYNIKNKKYYNVRHIYKKIKKNYFLKNW